MVANRDYFADAIKRHGFQGKGPGGNVDHLLADYQKQTKGLDQELAFKALEGGRQFGESDRARYDKLVKERDAAAAAKAKEKAQAHQKQTTNKTQVVNTPKPVQKNPQQPTTFKPETKIENKQEQTVTQDNDINQTMGDDNIVTNNVDNSVRQYGGDNRSMVINTNGKGSLTKQLDGAATAATLGGFYDVDDSPAANASFVDRYNVMNKDMQKGFQDPSDFTTKAIGMANKFTQMDANRFDKRIQARQRKNESKSRLMFNDIFGDPSKKTADWQRPDTPAVAEEPDWDDMYGKMTDF